MSSIAKRRAVPTTSSVPPALVGTVLAVSSMGASAHAIRLDRQMVDVRSHLASVASCARQTRRERFKSLARRWREDTQWQSSSTEIAMHPAYQAIIGMGADALPLIVEELRENSGHWFWALKSIANEDPVPPCDRGAIKRMRIAWLRWAAEKGLIDQ